MHLEATPFTPCVSHFVGFALAAGHVVAMLFSPNFFRDAAMKFLRFATPVLFAIVVSQAVADVPPDTLKRREDIAQFRREFFDNDRAYPLTARLEAEQRLTALEKDADRVDQIAFALELARVSALADNGHTGSSAASRSRRLERVDVRLVPFGEEFYVLRARVENADLLGARLASIDGVSASTLRTAVRALQGGTPAWRDRAAAYFFESPPQLRAAGIGSGSAAPVYAFVTDDGRTLERTFAVSPAGADRVGGNATRWMFPVLAPLEDRAWRTLIDAERAPWALQEPVKRFRWRHEKILDALVIEMRQSSSSANEKLRDFFEAVEKAIDETRPTNLVLDLRLNAGGDLTATRDFAERLPRLVTGRIFALTSPWTFSAAISTLGYLKQAAAARVTIVGEPVGDRLNFFAEGKAVTLTNSKESFLYASERHEYRSGCRQYDDCHRPIVSRPINVQSLEPDIKAPWTIGAYRAARDPAMEAVAAALGQASAISLPLLQK